MTSDQDNAIEAAVGKAIRPTMVPVKEGVIVTNTPRHGEDPHARDRPWMSPPKPAGATPQDTIAERGRTHGDFDDNAALSQILKDAMRGFQRKDGVHPWDNLTPAMKDTLDMNAAKIGRIFAGDPDFRDHWADMAGYDMLIANRCSK